MDLVERLRQPVMLHSNAEQTNAERREAADLIERLNAALRDLLDAYGHPTTRWPVAAAKAEALLGGPEQRQDGK